MKIKVLTFLTFIFFMLSACNNNGNPQDHQGEIYSVALNHIMEENEALNHQMEFIAIDRSGLTEISEQDRKEILTFFKDKYKVDVMEANLEELKEGGYFKPEIGVLDGVLLTIKKVEKRFHNNIFMEFSKYRAVDGGILMEVTISYKDGKWQVKKSKVTRMG